MPLAMAQVKFIPMTETEQIIDVLIVDDEKEACTNLKNIITEYFDDGINVAGKAHNTREAEKQISKLHPDAVFLDIEMPNENAFRFLERIAPFSFEVIFVTAFDEYAIKAFKLNAVDYILKPISIPELGQAIRKLKDKIRVKKILTENSNTLSYADLANQLTNRVKNHKITLKDNNIVEVVDFKDIYFVEAQGSYIRVLFLKDDLVKEIIMSGSLTDYEELLPPEMFFRIHKSYVINCLHVKKIIRGEFAEAVVKENYNLPISRRRYTALIDFLKSNNYYSE
jgi:two-component system, LytTR family, response regulator